MKEIKFICAQPTDLCYTWQVHLWLENLKELGYSNKAIVLLFVPLNRVPSEKWKELEDLYPEVEFHYYKDNGKINPILPIYIPVLRPYCLWQYWKEHPEAENQTIFYYDCDVLLTPEFNLNKYINDDICYVSDTRSYLNATYFDSKIKDVLPQKLDNYKKIDVLDAACKLVGINRQIAEEHNEHTGGAQYLLKNIDVVFWEKMIQGVINVRVYLQEVNKTYFLHENKGFQSWCADMFYIMWALWERKQEVKIIPEMNFAWVTDPIEKLQKCTIYHNAGADNEFMYNYPVFYKGKYIGGNSPMKDPHLDVILNNEESKKHCTWWYTKKLDELRNKYKDIYS